MEVNAIINKCYLSATRYKSRVWTLNNVKCTTTLNIFSYLLNKLRFTKAIRDVFIVSDHEQIGSISR